MAEAHRCVVAPWNWHHACAPCLKKAVLDHSKDCPYRECQLCGMRDCPFHSETHYWHDGCVACTENAGRKE